MLTLSGNINLILQGPGYRYSIPALVVLCRAAHCAAPSPSISHTVLHTTLLPGSVSMETKERRQHREMFTSFSIRMLLERYSDVIRTLFGRYKNVIRTLPVRCSAVMCLSHHFLLSVLYEYSMAYALHLLSEDVEYIFPACVVAFSAVSRYIHYSRCDSNGI